MSRDTNKSGKQQANEPKMVNTDLFTLTYGALISDLLGDLESAEEVNRQLDKIGYNMGQRMADDFLAKNPRVGKCSDIQQIMEIVVKSGFKTYLGLPAQINPHGNSGDEFSILFDPNPLVELVEKPTELKGLCYSQLICGCIRGALEALHMEVQVVLTADSPDPTEMRVKFHRVLHESLPAGDEL